MHGSDFSAGAWLGSGALTLAVIAAFVVGWKAKSGTRWRWFLAGAFIWAVGVGLKFIFVDFFYEPALGPLRASLPWWAYLAVGSVYAGALTGIFEDGATLALAFRWREWAREPNRAVAIGIGAGALEALLVALLLLGSGLWAVADAGARAEMRAEFSAAWGSTAIPWLALPFERLMAILAHTSSRVLALLTVATGKWRYFWYALLLSTGIDGLATLFILAGKVGRISTWWIELAIAPFAIVSVPIIIWAARHWPMTRPCAPADALVNGGGI